MQSITGFWQINERDKDRVSGTVKNMSEFMNSESPGFKFWTDSKTSLSLGRKDQIPHESFCGRYAIVFNGELYNASRIEQELEGNTASQIQNDEELVLAAVSKWGLDKSLEKLDGIFVFFLWDKHEQLLFLVRDRIGAKLLYYGIQNKTLFFSSELRTFRANNLFKPKIDRNALALFFRYSYVPVPYSIYEDILKLRQGSYLSIDRNLNIKEHSYWDALSVAAEGANNLFECDENKIAHELEDLLTASVRERFQKNNESPGVLLSGGIDSSLIAALSQKDNERRVNTFSIGFSHRKYDEAFFAGEVAASLNTEHVNWNITPRDAVEVISKLPGIYDEPFSDSSQIPTFLVLQFARRFTPVSLSGDGGDEVFGGYNRYLWADHVWNKTGELPYFAKFLCAEFIKKISPETWDNLAAKFSRFYPVLLNHRMFGDKLHKLADALTSSSQDELYVSLASHWKKPEKIVLDSREPDSLYDYSYIRKNLPNFVERMMFFDLVTYLPDDGLVKVTKAAGCVGIKTRSPILDHKIIEFSKRIPLSMKIRDGKNKWILRKILYKYVPQEIIDRPKMGFGIPINDWLRTDLREWAENLLDEKDIKTGGILNPVPIRKLWREHLTGKRNWAYHLWDVLMFQAWKKEWM